MDGTPPTTHVAVGGDTLGDLAGRFYGSQYANQYGAQIIATANPQYYSGGGQLLNCLCVGWILNIPEATSDAINAAHAAQSANPTGANGDWSCPNACPAGT